MGNSISIEHVQAQHAKTQHTKIQYGKIQHGPKDVGWICSQCTFQNESTTDVCKICHKGVKPQKWSDKLNSMEHHALKKWIALLEKGIGSYFAEYDNDKHAKWRCRNCNTENLSKDIVCPHCDVGFFNKAADLQHYCGFTKCSYEEFMLKSALSQERNNYRIQIANHKHLRMNNASLDEIKKFIIDNYMKITRNGGQFIDSITFSWSAHTKFIQIIDDDGMIRYDVTPNHFKIDAIIKKECQKVFTENGNQCKYDNDCNILKRMINDMEYSENNLLHIQSYSHSQLNNYQANTDLQCDASYQCESFQRLMNDDYSHKLNDTCHLTLYWHPPSLSRYVEKLKFDNNNNKNDEKEEKDSAFFEYETGYSVGDVTLAAHSEIRGKSEYDTPLIHLLIEEMIKNGYEYDLIPRNNIGYKIDINYNEIIDKMDAKNNIATMDIKRQIALNYFQEKYILIDLLFDKFNHVRHQQMGCPLLHGELFSLIMYTSCHCFKDLRTTQRNHDFNKWKIFDFALNSAIMTLFKFETHKEVLYCGLTSIKVDLNKLNKPEIKNTIVLTSYLSTSTDFQVANAFSCNGNGCIFAIKCVFSEDKDDECDTRQLFGCDVSWISKYPREKEVLLARNQKLHVFVKQCAVKANCQFIVCAKTPQSYDWRIDDYDAVKFEQVFDISDTFKIVT